jgi:hypothetical protein
MGEGRAEQDLDRIIAEQRGEQDRRRGRPVSLAALAGGTP